MAVSASRHTGRTRWHDPGCNLANNAVRACADLGGKVEILGYRAGEDVCRIQVVDDGPGIPLEMHEVLFRPFATDYETSGGTGLGLFITKRCVQKLGGTIRVQTCSAGTTFTIDLPVVSS